MVVDRKEHDRTYRQRNRERIREYNETQRQRVREWLKEYKSTLICQSCGFDHPAALQFHHRDPSEKEITLATAVRQGWSIERIKKEIEKCDILCANYHLILHAGKETV